MQLIRNSNIIPYVPEDGKKYYYLFDIFAHNKKRLHYYWISVGIGRQKRYYNYYSFNKRETFYYTSYINIFKNLYLNFLDYAYKDFRGADHEYFILAPSAEVKVRKEYLYG